MEGAARHQRAEPKAFGRRRERREGRPSVPRAALGATVVSVEQVVAEPDRVEADLLGRSRHPRELRPADVALDLRELHADGHRPGHRRSVRG
jgi:hypothetical protein